MHAADDGRVSVRLSRPKTARFTQLSVDKNVLHLQQLSFRRSISKILLLYAGYKMSLLFNTNARVYFTLDEGKQLGCVKGKCCFTKSAFFRIKTLKCRYEIFT